MHRFLFGFFVFTTNTPKRYPLCIYLPLGIQRDVVPALPPRDYLELGDAPRVLPLRLEVRVPLQFDIELVLLWCQGSQPKVD